MPTPGDPALCIRVAKAAKDAILGAKSSPCSLLATQYEVSPEMTSLPAKVIAIEQRGDQYQVIVQISTKYRGSFNTLAFGEIKPYSGSLKDSRLDLTAGWISSVTGIPAWR